MPQVDPVILQLKADVDKYNADISSSQRLTDEKLGAIEARGLAMGESLRKGYDLAKTAALAYAATAGVSMLTGAISDGLEYASSLGEQAQQLGITTDALQEYRFAATQVGISSDEMDQAISQLTRRIGEAATGTKAQAEAFQKLGVSVRDANGNVKSAAEIIPEIADGYKRLGSEAERTAVGTDLFGRSAYKLGPLLAGGSAGINELRDAAHTLGVVLDGNLINNADAAADKLSALQAVLKAQIAGSVAANAGAIIQFANALGTLIDYAGRADAALKRFQLNFREYQAQAKITQGLTSGVQAQGIRELAEIRGQRANAAYDGLTRKAGLGMSVQDFVGGGRGAGGGGAAVPKAVVPKAGGGGGGGGGASGPSAEEIAHRFDAERAQIMEQYNQALGSMATSAEEEAELELRSVELARIRSRANIDRDKYYSDIQKQELRARINDLAEVERDRVERQKSARIEQERADLLRAQNDIDRSELDAVRDSAVTQAERREIGLALVDLEYELKRQLLEQVIASKSSTDAMKERARLQLDNLDGQKGRDQASVRRDTEGPLGQYLRKTDPARNAERAEQLITDELDHVQQGISKALTDALGVSDDPLISGLIDMLLEQILFRPIAEALSNGAGGGGGGGFGGFISSVVGSIFGRASGGPVTGGQMYRVNEGASSGRVEGFIPQGSGKIVPLGQMSDVSASRSTVLHQTVNVDARGVNPTGFADHIRAAVRQETMAIVGKGMQQVNQNVPKRMAQYNRDGT